MQTVSALPLANNCAFDYSAAVGLKGFFSFCAFALFGSAVSARAAEPACFVYIGTYTKGSSQGIYAARFDPSTGALSKPELAAKSENPSFVAFHPSRPCLYAVGTVFQPGGKRAGIVSAFKTDAATGQLALLNQVSSRGTGPCHLVVDATGRYVLLANYNSGSAAVIAIKEDGSLGESTGFVQHSGSGPCGRRQEEPHAHSINLSADNRFAFVADLGLDKVFIYKFDRARGTLAPNDVPFAAVPPGSGPRHFAFHPDNKRAYVINEMGSTITAFNFDADAGALETIETVSSLPAGFRNKNTTAEIQVHPSGKFAYGSNRGHDSIAVFSVDKSTGRLALLEHASSRGKTPRGFSLDPGGRWLIAANQDSNNILVYEIDPATGRLSFTGQEYEVGTPVCVKFMAAK
ncbi:MAG: lactonase family protein [Kiritimatiellae bacterium]|nr:lactonase family protein [Kiritimatiellia bacterium]